MSKVTPVSRAKKGSYFESNISQLNSILSELDKVNIELNNYTSNLENENTKIDDKIQEFNNTIDSLNPETDAELIASMRKKIINLNKNHLRNQRKIERFNKYSDEEKVIFVYGILGIPYKAIAQPAEPGPIKHRVVIDLPRPVPIGKKKTIIPSPSSAQQQAELNSVISRFNDRYQTQKTLLNDYLTKHILPQPAQA